jgi:pSer/pThr/pTyr-binding forkhead associated (FHA) protein
VKFTLHIEGPYEKRSVAVEDSLSIGRTDMADVALDDSGLSRVNTTFFVDEGDLLVADENSTNGTFLNGERIEGRPRILRNGDKLTIGSSTSIRIEIGEETASIPAAEPIGQTTPSQAVPPKPAAAAKPAAASTAAAAKPESVQLIVIASVLLTFVILLFGGIGIYFLLRTDSGTRTGPSGTPMTASALIPVRVIDPLGGEDEEELDDLISSWEVAEDEIIASDVADIASAPPESEEAELNVSASLLADRQRLALADRPGEKGIRPAGLQVPKELFGDGVIKQKQKLAQMNREGYQQPLDFADLAAKRMSRDLVEMPMATNSFYLDVGGSAQDKVFSSFSFQSGQADIVPGHPKYDILKRLADNFAGQKYDLNLPEHRKQMRRRLLRMFQPPAKPILKELADAYFARFQRPLRVTSLTRSMDYQILLNSNNANSFKVRGEGSLPPHTSGAAFDLARKHMPAEEQNFVMAKLAEMERAGKLDALIEYGVNACFHVFIYPDGSPPRASDFSSYDNETFPFLAGIRLTSGH